MKLPFGHVFDTSYFASPCSYTSDVASRFSIRSLGGIQKWRECLGPLRLSLAEQKHSHSDSPSEHIHTPRMTTTAKRSPPFRAEHLGSLLRPDDLIQKRYAVAKGEASESDLEPLEATAIKEIVELQKECGVHPVSDGESFFLAAIVSATCPLLADSHETARRPGPPLVLSAVGVGLVD